MKKHVRTIMRAAREEAALAGATVTRNDASKHNRLVLVLGNEERLITFARSPQSPENLEKAMRHSIRRALREMRDC